MTSPTISSVTPPGTSSIAPLWPVPDLSKAAFIAPNATVIGHVEVGEGASVWFGAVARGDVEQIRIGDHANVQDGAVLHGDPGFPTVLEAFVTVGHKAVVHGAYIEEGCLIGIGAIILNGVRVGAGSTVGAGAVVNRDVPPRSLVVGVPGKVIRQMSETDVEELIVHAKKYEQLARAHAGKSNDIGFA